MKKVGLGSELKAILSLDDINISTQRELKQLPIGDLQPGIYQPRRAFDEESLKELADSISSQGILQPIVAREVDGRFEIIAGERRWRAAKIAKLSKVPVVVGVMSDESALALVSLRILQRQD